jgi:TRAP-type C4-dicarboxylate transport system substrate-binding protein
MKKVATSVLLFSVLALAVFLLAGVPIHGAAAEKPIELRLAHMFPVGSPSAIHMERWAEKIAADSQGRLKIRIFPVNTLLPAPEIFDGVARGSADIGFSFRYLPKSYTIGVAMPFIMGAPDTFTASKVYDDLWKKFPKEMNEEWKQARVLWLGSSAPQMLHTRKLVRVPEDLKGMQIRVPSKEMGDFIKDVGGAPAFMPTADFVVAIEKGTVDGATIHPEAVHDNKIGGKVKYCLDISLGCPTPVQMTMNHDAYNKLPADLKSVIDKSLQWGKDGANKFWDEAFEKVKPYFKETGVEIVSITPAEKARWAAAMERARDRVGKDLDGKGLPGTEIVQYIRERVKFYEKK